MIELPEEPTKEILIILAVHEYPDDHEAGKDGQRRLGLDVIPPNAEMEMAYGKYKRLVNYLKGE